MPRRGLEQRETPHRRRELGRSAREHPQPADGVAQHGTERGCEATPSTATQPRSGPAAPSARAGGGVGGRVRAQERALEDHGQPAEVGEQSRGSSAAGATAGLGDDHGERARGRGARRASHQSGLARDDDDRPAALVDERVRSGSSASAAR